LIVPSQTAQFESKWKMPQRPDAKKEKSPRDLRNHRGYAPARLRGRGEVGVRLTCAVDMGIGQGVCEPVNLRCSTRSEGKWPGLLSNSEGQSTANRKCCQGSGIHIRGPTYSDQADSPLLREPLLLAGLFPRQVTSKSFGVGPRLSGWQASGDNVQYSSR